MRLLVYILFVSMVLPLSAQIDYTKLIIARTTGEKTFYDGNTTRIFGFAETLGEIIDIPGPTIEVKEGDSVKIDLWNMSQGAPHTIHLHGLDVDQANDGVPMFSFEVGHMEHGYYYFKGPHPGTYLYHCHVTSAIHVQAGMYGVLIVRPSGGETNLNWTGGEYFDREFVWASSEIDTLWHADTILNHAHDSLNPMMEVPVPPNYKPQYFLLNGLSDTQLADPLNYFVAGENEDVYLRLANIGYYGVRYIFPAVLNARTVASDGRPLPADVISDTVEIYPGERHETMVITGMGPLYPVTVEFFNLNTQEVESVQTAYIRTSALSLEDMEASKVTIYPIPSSTGVFFADQPFESGYTVVDLYGRTILTGQDQMIDLSRENPGIYLLRYQETTIRLVYP